MEPEIPPIPPTQGLTIVLSVLFLTQTLLQLHYRDRNY